MPKARNNLKTKHMATKRPAKSSKVIARSVSKRFRFSFRNPTFLLVVLAVAVFGGYFLYYIRVLP
jgi:hypothetical protein